MNSYTNQTMSAQPKLNLESEAARLLRLSRLSGYVGDCARSQLIQQHYRWIKQRCYYTLGNEADANDAAQEVALRVYKALPKFEGRSSIRTWMNTIVHHECVSLIRKRQRAALSEHMESLITLHEINQRNAQSTAEIPVDAVQKALGELPSQAKEVLQLRFFTELPLDEIGAILGISLSATKMRLYRALELFKGVYQRSNSDEAVFA